MLSRLTHRARTFGWKRFANNKNMNRTKSFFNSVWFLNHSMWKWERLSSEHFFSYVAEWDLNRQTAVIGCGIFYLKYVQNFRRLHKWRIYHKNEHKIANFHEQSCWIYLCMKHDKTKWRKADILKDVWKRIQKFYHNNSSDGSSSKSIDKAEATVTREEEQRQYVSSDNSLIEQRAFVSHVYTKRNANGWCFVWSLLN